MPGLRLELRAREAGSVICPGQPASLLIKAQKQTAASVTSLDVCKEPGSHRNERHYLFPLPSLISCPVPHLLLAPEAAVHTSTSYSSWRRIDRYLLGPWSSVLRGEEKEEVSYTVSRDLKSPTPMGEHFSTNFSSWDLAVPGSPSISKLMSPRRVSPSGSLEQQGAGKRWWRHGEPLFQ